MIDGQSKTLRLVMPQWQGGNNPAYHFGAQLLAWLAPPTSGPTEETPVRAPDGRQLESESGIVARGALLEQLHAAMAIIERHRPERIVMLGGDCLVDLAPLAYLNDYYEGDLAVLWLDAHPDVMTPKEYSHAHAMVLGSLLGKGDPDFAEIIRRKLDPRNVMFAGLRGTSAMETDFIKQEGLRHAAPEELALSSEPVLAWLRETGAKRLAVHFDLDALDPAGFGSLLFRDPEAATGAFEGVAKGKMTMEQVIRLLVDVDKAAPIVGLAITEHMPWDSLALKQMLARLPLLGRSESHVAPTT